MCPVDTITLWGEHLQIDSDPCISCGLCIKFCPVGALTEGQEYGEKPSKGASRIITVPA